MSTPDTDRVTGPTTDEMRALGLNVRMRDQIARWAADPASPIDDRTWASYPPGYRALLRAHADRLIADPIMAEALVAVKRVQAAREALTQLAGTEFLSRAEAIGVFRRALYDDEVTG